MKSIILIAWVLLASLACTDKQKVRDLHIKSKTEVGQIEVGSPYLGIEIHSSYPMLNRISFYYPVANSIDISKDFWKRENYRIMSVGLKVGDTPKKLLEEEVYEVDQTPYSVSFYKQKSESGIEIKYEFCKDKPAMVITYRITNKSASEKDYEIYTRLETILKTSHTYKAIDTAVSDFDKKNNAISFYYNNVETGSAQISILNAGQLPTSFTTKSFTELESKSLDSWWLNNETQLSNTIISKNEPARPEAAFIYNKTLQPNENIEIVQIIVSSKIKEGKEQVEYLLNNYQKEVTAYENHILDESITKRGINTGNEILDFSTEWAKAILAANMHYLDDRIVPMPAQAEYNFYFTHDVLVTDLAVVNYDLNRVKDDLKFIISLANEENVIPHAYYWKDTEYKTEFADLDNWNNFWINLVSASYLRHSNDITFVEQLYPYLIKSIETALLTLGDDSLMWSYRPDWWDIGSRYGSKTYMTALASRTIHEYIFISTKLGKNIKNLTNYEKLADKLKDNMIKKLWSEEQNYLMNYYEPNKLDPHYYIGSLVPAYMGMLDKRKTSALLQTAKKYMLDEKVGIYNAFPMDFHTLGEYLNFSGNEAGQEYYYFNGGIWPQGNAWYALALIQNDQKKEALQFIKNIMTIDGIMKGPNGQPAMYEVRNGNKNNLQEYGKVDKPQFSWAAGWYIYTLNNLFGIKENNWNISFDPYLPEGIKNINLSLTIDGNIIPVSIHGEGKTISSIKYNGIKIPSAVIPSAIGRKEKIEIKLGKLDIPYLTKANANVYGPQYSFEHKTLEFTLESFKDHKVEFEILSPIDVESIMLNNCLVDSYTIIQKQENYMIRIKTVSQNGIDNYAIKFN